MKGEPKKSSQHDPRLYLLGGDDVVSVNLGRYEGDGFPSGDGFYSDQALLENLHPDQRIEFKQARAEGFHPVLVIDLESDLYHLEMRKQITGPKRLPHDGV